jgi:hypothetical protein
MAIPVQWGTKTGVDLSCRRVGGRLWGSAHWPDVGQGKEGPIVTTKPKPLDLPICSGSATYPDIVNDEVLDELAYVCAACRARMPNFELAPVHRHALHGATVLGVRLDQTDLGFPTTAVDGLCVIEK